MRVGIVAPSAVPANRGGAERAVAGLARAITDHAGHECELVKLPVDESTLAALVHGYEAFAGLDLDRFDLVISTKYPAWIAPHHNHVVLMFHPLRGLYDTYHLFGLPEWPSPHEPELAELLHLVRRRHDVAALPEFFAQFDRAVREHGPHHPDLALPGPLAREIVRWLDVVAMAPAQMRRHFALSRTVARRPGYFPPGVTPAVNYLPSDLGPLHDGAQRHLFTASRLDGPKRIDLLVRAMAHVPGDVPLLIAGTGPESDRLVDLAAGDRRIRFLGFVDDDALIDLYADALAVPFIPDDEDLGLITLEAMGSGSPVVTCLDSGGPTELVADGVTGVVVAPDPTALGRALAALVRDPGRAADLGRAGKRRAARVTWAGAVTSLLTDDRPASAPVRRRTRSGTDRPARPKIVVTATFRVHPPRGGGQMRCFHLYGALARHADVEVVSLVDPVHREGSTEIGPGLVQTLVARSPTQLDVDIELSSAARMPVTDIVAGTHIWATPAYLQALRRAADGAAVIILAEPYLGPALAMAGIDAPFIYDAFNVESALKAATLPATPLGRDLLESVIELEERAMTGAAAVTACSAEDADALAVRYGRPRTDVVVIPNGTDTTIDVPTPGARRAAGRRWRDRFIRNGPERHRPAHLALFFASWHPPNLDAAELVLELAPDLPDVLFLMAGSHGEAFQERVMPPNVVMVGVVADTAKAALLGAADVALNPMRQGSGTNLKVIEYLAAGVPTISTPFGVRGLEVIAGEHLLVAAPDELAQAVRTTVDDPAAAQRRAAAGRALVRESYDWHHLGDRLHSVVVDVLTAADA